MGKQPGLGLPQHEQFGMLQEARLARLLSERSAARGDQDCTDRQDILREGDLCKGDTAMQETGMMR
jgi:hypothetical protein